MSVRFHLTSTILTARLARELGAATFPIADQF
jgi:hypothetical protein